ncbi:ABC transporter ATP-binding protein/permease [Alphaproteobacteria bacterium]|nr:ABC transporter ATP-binding protein/permease [Alphaproteobacteria bacterium]
MFKDIKIFRDNDKKGYYRVLTFTFIGAIAEMFSIALLVFFLTLMSDEVKLYKLMNKIDFFNIKNSFSKNDLMIILISIFVLIQTIKSILVILMYYFQADFIYNLRTKISSLLLKKYLYLSLSNYNDTNSSKFIRNIIIESQLACTGFVLPVILIFTEMLVFTLIISLIFISNKYIALVILISILLFFLLYMSLLKKKLGEWGNFRQEYENNRIKFAKESIGLYKIINLNNLQNVFYGLFVNINKKLAKIEKIQLVISPIPRLIIEFSAVILLAILILIYSYSSSDITQILPTLGLLIASGLRLLPSFNRILTSYQKIGYNKSVVNLLNQELSDIKSIDKKTIQNKNIFKKNISFKNLEYSLKESGKKLLQINNLKIKKNEKIGIYGRSGSGKSTFIDLIMGFRGPDKGNIILDDLYDLMNIKYLNSWKTKIGYVPQKMTLLDDTIINNITLNFDNKKNNNFRKINEIIEISCLKSFIKSSTNGLETIIGENGSKISGGEIQRICIARALYNNPEFLILDEATSALDKDTENFILKNLFELKTTIIFISHKLSSLKNCDKVFKIENKKLVLKN